MFIEFFFLIKIAANTFSLKRNKKMENQGIDPSASRMKSGHSTIWANPPARKTSVNN